MNEKEKGDEISCPEGIKKVKKKLEQKYKIRNMAELKCENMKSYVKL